MSLPVGMQLSGDRKFLAPACLRQEFGKAANSLIIGICLNVSKRWARTETLLALRPKPGVSLYLRR